MITFLHGEELFSFSTTEGEVAKKFCKKLIKKTIYFKHLNFSTERTTIIDWRSWKLLKPLK